MGNRTRDFIDQYVPILIEGCSKIKPPIKSFIKVNCVVPTCGLYLGFTSH